MKDYFNSLNEREKWMVVIGGSCLIIYLFYFLLYSPLHSKVRDKSTQLVEKTETLQWMKQIRQENHNLQSKKNVTNSQLLSLLATQLKENNTLNFPFQLQQTSSGEVQLSFDEVPIQLFISWLSKMNENYAIAIKQFDIERTNKPGVTRLMIIINAAG